MGQIENALMDLLIYLTNGVLVTGYFLAERAAQLVALAVAIMIMSREAGNLFGQHDYGYDVIVGAKGSPLQLTLNTVYHLDKSPGNIAYSLYEKMLRDPAYRPLVRIAVPTAVGDSYKNRRIVGASDPIGGYPVDRPASPADVAATLYSALGISLTKELPSPGNRPIPVVDYAARPIRELL